MDKFLSVSQLATHGNTTSRAIRLYMGKGLLTPVQIGHNFFFTENTQLVLENILRAKRLGFSLKEIKSCQIDRDAQAISENLKRLETLISDAQIEIKALRNSLTEGDC